MPTKNILIINAEENLRNLLLKEFKEYPDTNVMFACDGLDACRKTRNQKFDLIISDFKMSKLSGSELLFSLREQIHNAQTPIVVTTENLDEARNACLKSEISINIDFVKSPFDVKDIYTRCIQILNTGKVLALKPKLDADFINPFLNAVVYAIKTMGQLAEVQPLKTVLLKPGEEKHADITGQLAIEAPAFVGSISISFPAKTYLTIVSNLLGKQFPSITSDIEDVAAEIVNIVYGNAKAVLNERNYQMKTAIPSLIKDSNHAIRSKVNSPTLVTEFSSTAGPFFVSISIRLANSIQNANP